MLGAADGQLAGGVIVDDLGDGVKGRAVLAQDVFPVLGLGKLDVHEALAAPVKGRDGE